MNSRSSLAGVLELAELLLRLVSRVGIDTILDQLEDGEITLKKYPGPTSSPELAPSILAGY